MNLVAWNNRGLGMADSLKVPYVASLIRSFGVDIIFLMETLVSVDVAVQKLSSVGFDGFCGSVPLGLCVGLVFFLVCPGCSYSQFLFPLM